MSETPFYSIVIIGDGPGGLTAGIYAMRVAMKAILIEKLQTRVFRQIYSRSIRY